MFFHTVLMGSVLAQTLYDPGLWFGTGYFEPRKQYHYQLLLELFSVMFLNVFCNLVPRP